MEVVVKLGTEQAGSLGQTNQAKVAQTIGLFRVRLLVVEGQDIVTQSPRECIVGVKVKQIKLTLGEPDKMCTRLQVLERELSITLDVPHPNVIR